MKIIRETLKYATGLSKIWDNNTPAQIIFFVTSRCNSRCRHCFYWQEIEKQKKDELTLEEIKKISRSMGRIFWLFLSGGEPFIRADLSQICQTFYNNNKVNSIVIPTNGILVKKIISDSQTIARNCPKAKIIIQVSIDEIGEKHDRLRGVPGNFAKIEKLMPLLKKCQKRFPNIAIQANIVFIKDNQKRVKEIYDEILRRFKVDNICLSLVRGSPREVGTKQVDIKKYWQAQQHLRKTKRFNQYSSILSYLITKKEDFQVEHFIYSLKNEKALIPCLSGQQSAVISPNGNLAICELRKEIFGNLREVNYQFSRLWEGPRAKNIRAKVQGCYCTQECVYTTNVFLNPKIWVKFGQYLLTGNK